jgi:hypothetical protein
LTGPSGREDLHPKKSEVQAKTADKRKGKKKKKKKKKKRSLGDRGRCEKESCLSKERKKLGD